jgi:ubiquinone/menaquinone biosynthesis C-methylase UbiE
MQCMMTGDNTITNEQLSATAFTKQSVIFDDIYATNTIVNYKRSRVRNHVNRYLQPNSNILELNAGTGEDAIYFARQLNNVHATDISEGMLKQLVSKVKKNNLEKRITSEKCSFTELGALHNKGPYDLIFSNFAGLNCTDKLQEVLSSFNPLLAPNGLITLVLLPKFCLWETLMLFKGKFRTAFRRLNSKSGADAHIEGIHFKCWYYNPSFVINTLKDDFEVLALEGLCTIVPPSYLENFAENHPTLYDKLTNLENRLKNKWPWRQIGDYYIITLRKK